MTTIYDIQFQYVVMKCFLLMLVAWWGVYQMRYRIKALQAQAGRFAKSSALVPPISSMFAVSVERRNISVQCKCIKMYQNVSKCIQITCESPNLYPLGQHMLAESVRGVKTGCCFWRYIYFSCHGDSVWNMLKSSCRLPVTKNNMCWRILSSVPKMPLTKPAKRGKTSWASRLTPASTTSLRSKLRYNLR